jgi:hypothetical protein
MASGDQVDSHSKSIKMSLNLHKNCNYKIFNLNFVCVKQQDVNEIINTRDVILHTKREK